MRASWVCTNRLTKEADRGDADAQTRLGLDYLYGVTLYRDGSKTEKDFVAAEKWLTRAAEQGHAWAQYRLGKIYFIEECEKTDYWKAIKWLLSFEGKALKSEQLSAGAEQQALRMAIAEAQYALGEIYYQETNPDDDFIPFDFCSPKDTTMPASLIKDYSTARAWYHKAAERDNKEAQYQLAGMYHAGRGGPQDYTEAAAWYQKAAENGHNKAPRALGRIYIKLDNSISAHMWFNVAGDAKARDSVGKTMTSHQIITAQKLATEWVRMWRQPSK